MTFTRTILIFLVSLIFSALLWSYVRLSSAYEADVDLPIKLTAPKGYALASGLPTSLHARVRGAGWQILVMNFAKNAIFQFDLAERAVPMNAPFIIHSDEITHSALMPSELRILKVEPDSLRLFFGNAVEKRIAVKPRVDVQPGKGYVVVGAARVSPAFVTVMGARAVLDSLDFISTKALEASDAKEDVDRTVELSDSLSSFITIPNAPKINVHIEVQAIGEKTIPAIPVAVEALPPQYEMLVIPGTVSVTVRGGVDELAKLTPASFHARALYDPMIFDTAHTFTPQIELPKSIRFLSTDPPRLKFIMRRKPSTPNATR